MNRALARHGRRASTLRLLGAGLDHAAFEVDGELIVRVSGDDDGGQVDREARLLHAVAAVSPLPVPVPLFAEPDLGCLAYRALPGRRLIDVDDASQLAVPVGSAVGNLLAVLHRQPAEQFAGLLDEDTTPLSEWLVEAREMYPGVRAAIPDGHRTAVEAFLAHDPPADPAATVPAHNDLGIEHVLVDATGRVSGVIDWSDAALTDPARDLALLYRDLGPAALAAALETYGQVGEEVRRRVEFYARCGALEDLGYGIDTGSTPYVTKTLRALAWLFPAATRPAPVA
ncbi:aminoglycoside phosphotransferase family protein [Georgenia sp. H159]|uniref:phosphotransferase family protein n=1 Tax=Georgenia sp. H159 TaxID=3076115 RepID=UPI002D78D241|nr:aminoglycoside phosphotransferase family protein [Georgenia sp. H159]